MNSNIINTADTITSVAYGGVPDGPLLCLLLDILMPPKDFSNKSTLIPRILVHSDIPTDNIQE